MFIMFSIIIYILIIFSENLKLLIGSPEILYTNFTGFFVTAVRDNLFHNHITRVVTVIFISFLAGLNLVIILRNLSFTGFTALPGSVFGIAFTGCPACTAGVLSIAGFSIGTGIFPLGGLEFNLLALVLLIYSLFYLSHNEVKEFCEIEIYQS